MPQIVKCAGCGEVLYEGREILTPGDVIDRVGGKCPKCGRKLSLRVLSCEVKPHEG